MNKVDPFTRRRLERFIEEHRTKSGQLPSLQDFEAAGIKRETIDQAERDQFLEKFYVTLTNGTVIKGYKVKL